MGKLKRAAPLLIFAAVLLLLQNRWRLQLLIDPVPTAGWQAADITLYSTSWCGYCAKTRRFFAAADIPYRERDIEQSEQALREYEALGGRGVPLIRIGQQVVRGFDPAAIREALAAGINSQPPAS